MIHVAQKLVLTTVLFTAILPSLANAQSQREIEEARKKGLDYIKSQQLDDGSWEFEGHEVGITALCAIALVENGMPVTDPVIENAHTFVKDNIKEQRQTYDLALAIIMLSRLDERGNKKAIRDCAARLVVGQLTSGGWSYTCPKATSLVLTNPDDRPAPKVGGGDNSCTQFAVLGLWTASRIGINISDTMARVADRFAESQNEDGGWPYRHPGEEVEASKGSMTFAGLFCLTVARATKLKQEKRRGDSDRTKDEGKTLREDPIFSKALAKAGAYAKGGDSARYYLWSMERMGVMLGQDKFADVDWFKKGAGVLLRTQGKDGSWKDSRGGLHETSFAVLFLRKANLGSDITRLLNGEPEKPFVIVSRTPAARYAKIEEALKASKAGEVIRVEGDGPFKMPHVNVDKDLTIEAGFGYDPVFEYGIGRDKRGLRARPARDENARVMLRVTKGTLTLEGLRLQMEPPELNSIVDWTAVRVDGGNLRMLNTTLTEGGRKKTAMVQVMAPASITLRNTLIAGGRAAIEVHSTGDQELQIDNCIFFSKDGVAVMNARPAKNSTKLTIRTNHSTFQTSNAFQFARASNPIDIHSTACVYKSQFIGESILISSNSRKNRSWHGGTNLYGPYKWLGAKRKELPVAKDLKSWVKFWGTGEEESVERAVGFEVTRPNGAFSHSVKPQDWELPDRLNLQRNRFGIESSIIGSGKGYSRFRESIDYNQWKAGRVVAAK